MAQREKMERNAAVEAANLLNQISEGSYLNLHHRRRFVWGNDSPRSWASQQSPYSASSSISNGVSSSEDGSMFDEAKYEIPSYGDTIWMDPLKPPDSHRRRTVNEKLVSDYFLAKKMNRMSIRDEGIDFSPLKKGFERDHHGFGNNLGGNAPYGSYNDFYHGDFGFDGFQSSAFGDFGGSDPVCSSSQRYDPWKQGMMMENEVNWGSNGGVQLQSEFSSITRPFHDFPLVTRHEGLDYRGSREVKHSSRLRLPKLASSVEKMLPFKPFSSEMGVTMPNNVVPFPQSPVSMKCGNNLQAFPCEDGFIMQGNGFKKRSLQEIAIQNLRERSSKMGLCINREGAAEYDQGVGSYSDVKKPVAGPYSLAEFRGRIYLMAKDQNGCRFLQGLFDEGATFVDIQIIFNGVIDHVVELMTDPFGNYLMQKLLEVCSDEQRMQIVVMVTKEHGQLVRISLNTYGTRVIQKLIETLKFRQEISIVKSALKNGILDLIKDLNGNHVLQCCLQCLNNDDNKFIFDAAAKYSVDIATHRHGCCVLQRCIAHSTGQHRDKLITRISRNGLPLCQDPFGNYVVQYIIDLQISPACTNFLSQFKGHYVQLSMQKFSSHVVEKCLKLLPESRPQIISEFLSVPNFAKLVDDPYANYVIQSALLVIKGNLRAALVEAIRPHMILRTSPYCKRIFSRKVLKK